MRKSEKNSVAIFLAVALFAGTFAGTAPAFVVDAQATEDKRDYKEKDRNYDKDYRHDDNKEYGDDGRDKYSKDREDKYGNDDYSKDREDKYGSEDKYSTYGKDKYGSEDKYSTYGKDKYGHDDYGKDREDKYGHDDKSSVKYIKCNNVNINGKDRNSNGGNHNGGMGGGNDWPRDGEENGFSHDSFMKRDNHNFPGFVKQTDKDVVVICIFNNDKKDKVPPVEPEVCDDCFLPRSEGGPIPDGLLRQLNEHLAEVAPEIGNVTGLCELILDRLGGPDEVKESEIRQILGDAWGGNANPNAIQRVVDCLLELELITPTDVMDSLL